MKDLMNMNPKGKPLIVICPGGNATGGVELLHQLVDAARKVGHPAFICYYPFGKKFSIPEPYKKYDCPTMEYSDVRDIASDIVLPEVYHYLTKRFSKSRIYLWWLSVDNYLNSLEYSYAWSNRFLPWYAWRIQKSPKSLAGHLYQSEYARQFIEGFGIQSGVGLSDYINQEYLQHSEDVNPALKKNIVAYNPAKGFEQLESIIQLANSVEFVPIKNMTRDEVVGLLKSAKIYIDFGNHPGKDRIPREAAIMGCCILTNKRGSANNLLDIRIPEQYKFDDMTSGYQQKVVNMMSDIFGNYANHRIVFDTYREVIRNEKALFEESVKKFLKGLLI
jgi:hypothetical protein